MKMLVKITAVVVGALVLLGAGAYGWASVTTARVLSRTFETHTVEFPVPFPLSEEERAASGLREEEPRTLAMERAIERGRHLVEARYACIECHGVDFSGGVMVDAAPLGRILGPNLTLGEGSVTASYRPSDWDRIVRHGVRPDGSPAAMPSEDFQLMSDQELSDVIAYIGSRPPVDNVVPPVKLGPVGKLLVATGRLPLSADLIESHQVAHGAYPPTAQVSVEFGRHLAGICTGCHHQDLAGGVIAAGDPSWAPARNITPHVDGLGRWTFEDFVTVMRQGVRPDGTPVLEPMTLVMPFAGRMTDVELEALWAYLRSVPPVPTAAP